MNDESIIYENDLFVANILEIYDTEIMNVWTDIVWTYNNTAGIEKGCKQTRRHQPNVGRYV